MSFNVRSYTRRGANGEKVQVTQHSKAGGGRRPAKKKNLAHRSWGNFVKAWRAGRKKKRWTAAAFALLATVELTTFVTLQTAAFALVTLAVTAAGVALLANLAAGGKGTNR